MSFDDFVARFKKQDPAASLETNLTPSQVAQQSMDREVSNVTPISTWTRKRKVISTVAAGLLVAGISGPFMSGAMTASGPERFVFGTSPEASGQMRSANESMLSSDMKIGLPYIGSYYIYESDIELSTQATSMMAYRIVPRDDAETIGRSVARSFGITNLKVSEYDQNSLEFASDDKFFNLYLSDSYTSLNYSDYTNDPWKECYQVIENPDGSTTSSDRNSDDVQECNPVVENLPSEAEAKRLAIDLMNSIGVNARNFKFEIWSDTAYVSVTATEYLDGRITPMSWNITYTSNSEVAWLYGSLTELEEISEYEVISETAALKRANELNVTRIENFKSDIGTNDLIDVEPTYSSEGDRATNEPGTIDGGSSEPNPGTTDEPSKPIDEPTFTFEPQIVHVTKIELTYETFWLADGSVVWLPTYQFFGYFDGEDKTEVYMLGSIVALIDDAIDLQSLYGQSISARLID